MLSLEYRPQTFKEMAGQDIVKKSLMHIVKDPTNAPKTILLCGQFGSGKTTAARIFAKALNCPNKTPDGDACGKPDCIVCGRDIQDSMFYSEYDSAVVGNVESIKELRDTFYFGYSKGYKVIVLDEVHLVSKAAQGALLKIIEEPEPNLFYVLCTTDPDKLLSTITSRSYELRYGLVEPEDMIPFLKKVLIDKGIEITPLIEKNLSLVAARSCGHMRNAMMLLDSMLLLKEDFAATVTDSRAEFISLITLGLQYHKLLPVYGADKLNNLLLSKIDNLNKYSIFHLRQDYERLVLDIAKATFFTTENKDIELLVEPFKESYNLINILNDPVVYQGFNNSVTFQVTMLVLFNKLKTLRR